jgi:hypothetical protein
VTIIGLSQLYPAEFYIKVDDDIYLNLEELSTMLKSHRDTPRVYIGCMKSGIVINDKRCAAYFNMSPMSRNLSIN